MATDLAEFLGAAIGFHLLFGMALFPAAISPRSRAFAILGLQRFGFRPLEAMIAAIVGVIGLCYVAELFKAKPPLGTVGYHAVVPRFQGQESVLLAVGILGATVMPHVIYLHSALMQDRIRPESDAQAKRLFHFTVVDVRDRDGDRRADQRCDARDGGERLPRQRPLRRRLARGRAQDARRRSSAAPRASSSRSRCSSPASRAPPSARSPARSSCRASSSARMPLFVRRLVTMVPAFAVIGIGVDPSRTLVISQVVLSFGIPFALIPLVMFTSRRDVMGVLVNARATTAAAAAVAAVISG